MELNGVGEGVGMGLEAVGVWWSRCCARLRVVTWTCWKTENSKYKIKNRKIKNNDMLKLGGLISLKTGEPELKNFKAEELR